MKTKMKKSNLDEMQEQELLKIEHNGCWIAFWGLLAALVIQTIAFGNTDIRKLAGESAVFMVLVVYLTIECVRRGIWDRRIPMNTKTNALISAIAALAFGVYSAVMIYRMYQKPAGTTATALIITVITFCLCFAGLMIAMKKTEKRIKQLEEEPSDADEM